MLEHVPDPGSVIAACADLAKPGGNLYFLGYDNGTRLLGRLATTGS